MNAPTPIAFQGEVQFRRYSDTSTQGAQITFAVHGREELESFIGKEGKRFMAVLVEIGDDEQAVARPGPGIPPAKEREPLGTLCYRSVRQCEQAEFWAWANSTTHGGIFWHCKTAKDAGDFVREICEVKSRKEFDTDKQARERYLSLIHGPYMKWLTARGVIR